VGCPNFGTGVAATGVFVAVEGVTAGLFVRSMTGIFFDGDLDFRTGVWIGGGPRLMLAAWELRISRSSSLNESERERAMAGLFRVDKDDVFVETAETGEDP
jgi:hypothetical protein